MEFGGVPPVVGVSDAAHARSLGSEPFASLARIRSRHSASVGLGMSSLPHWRFEYFRGKDIGYAIEIGRVRKYRSPFCPIAELGREARRSRSRIFRTSGPHCRARG